MNRPFSLVLALREGRSGFRRIGWFLLAIALGVGVLTGLYGFQKDAAIGVRSEARELLGGDLRIQSNNALDERIDAVLDSLEASGVRVARGVSLASIVSVPETGASRLLQVNAVDPTFPAAGTPRGDPPEVPARLRAGGGVAVDPQVRAQLGVAVGDRVRIGTADFEVLGELTGVPVDLGLQWVVGPPVFLLEPDLERTGILAFGSLAQHRAWVALAEGEDPARLAGRLRRELRGTGVQVRTAQEEAEAMALGFESLSRFLGLVGLLALVLGGIGVGSAVSQYLREKRTAMSVLRCLGAGRGTLLRAYLAQTLLLGASGALLGVVAGTFVQFLLPQLLGSVLPFGVTPRIHPEAVAGGLLLGTWIGLVFSLLPLLRVPNVSPLVALRALGDDEIPVPAGARVAVAAAVVGTLFALAGLQLGSVRAGAAVAGALAAGILVLAGTAAGLVRGVRAVLPAGAPFPVRHGLSGLFRPGNQTGPVLLSLGLGTFLLGALLVVEQGLRAGFTVAFEAEAPSLVLFDIQADQREGIDRLLAGEGIAAEQVPIVPARLASVGGIGSAELLERTRSRNAWMYRRVYRNTFRLEATPEDRIVEGRWWTEGDPEVPGIAEAVAEGAWRISLESGLARDLGVGIGDRIGWDVQGVLVETVITSLREVEWASMQPNFFAIFEPGALESAPGMSVALIRSGDAAGRRRVQEAVLRDFPNVSFLDVTTVQETLERISGQIALVLRSMAGFVLGGGVVVLVASLLTTRFRRRKESALLKTLGARGRTIRTSLLTEYAALGGIGGGVGAGLGAAGGILLLRELFEVPAPIPWGLLGALWLGVLAIAVIVGWTVSGPVLRSPPVEVLREDA